MATQAEIETELDSQGTKRVVQLVKSEYYLTAAGTTMTGWYAVAHKYRKGGMWVSSTQAETAANQAAEILAALA